MQLQNAITNVLKGELFFDFSEKIKINATVSHSDFGISGIESLTKRELQVARHMCSKKSYKEIAKILNISPNTIDNIRERVFKKMKVKNRSAVIMLLMQTGLLNY